MPSEDTSRTVPVTREEFELFLHFFTHEIRNQLNGIALEASDLAEQAGPQVDSLRLQRQIRECSNFLKITRDSLTSEESEKPGMPLSDFIQKLRDKTF